MEDFCHTLTVEYRNFVSKALCCLDLFTYSLIRYFLNKIIIVPILSWQHSCMFLYVKIKLGTLKKDFVDKCFYK